MPHSCNRLKDYIISNLDALVKSRHPGESRGPGQYKFLKTLDSGFRRNDGKGSFSTFYESINLMRDRTTKLKRHGTYCVEGAFSRA